MQTPLSQTLAYAVSQLRADFVAFSSRKPEDQCRQLRELLQTLLPHLRYSPAIPDRPDGPPALRGRMPE